MGAKRVSGASAASPSKKARVESIAPKVKAVVQALMDEDLDCEVPMNARLMLAKGAPAALGTVVEERHKVQEDIMSYIREVLADVNSKLVAGLDEKKKAIEKEATDLEAARSVVATDAAAVEEAEKVVKEQEDKLAEGKKAVHAAELEVKQLEQGQKANRKARDAAEKDKTKYTSIVERPEWKALIDGTWETDKEAHKFVKTLGTAFQKVGTEEALLVSAPAALTKKPEARGSFDAMVIDSLKAVVKAGEDTAQVTLSEIDKEAAALGEQAAAKTEVAEKSRAVRDGQAEELAKLQATLDEKVTTKATDEAGAEKCAAAVDERTALCAEAEARLASFTEVVESLEFLASRSSAPPEPEAPAADAATPAPADAAAAPAEAAA